MNPIEKLQDLERRAELGGGNVADVRQAEARLATARTNLNEIQGDLRDARASFQRVIGVDLGLVIPDERKTLRGGAVKTIQTPAWKEIQEDLLEYAGKAGIPRDTPWSKLSPEHREWVIEGDPDWQGEWNKQWYGIRRFFGYLESKAYKMHIRVLLSRYRAYTPCETCAGARLKPDALLWRLGTKEDADRALGSYARVKPLGLRLDEAKLAELRARQVRALRYLDGVFERLFDIVPRNTWVVVTSDHGELFGEDGYFGHGPIAHDKVFEVPFVEGAVR